MLCLTCRGSLVSFGFMIIRIEVLISVVGNGKRLFAYTVDKSQPHISVTSEVVMVKTINVFNDLMVMTGCVKSFNIDSVFKLNPWNKEKISRNFLSEEYWSQFCYI